MALTKKDLQSIKGIVKDIVQGSAQSTESKLKEFIMSQFRIQKIVLDAQFREINSKFDNLETRMTQGFDKTNQHLHEHDIEIDTIKERVPS